LFEANFPGDPNFERTKEAFEAIDSPHAAAGFRETFVVGAGLSGQYTLTEAEAPSDLQAGGFASNAARAAEYAARAAKSNGDESTNAAYESWACALGASQGSLSKKLTADFERVAKTARRQRWNDTNTAGPKIWNPPPRRP